MFFLRRKKTAISPIVEQPRNEPAYLGGDTGRAKRVTAVQPRKARGHVTKIYLIGGAYEPRRKN